MTPAPSISHLAAIYPTARIRGRFITRMEEKSIGWGVLDAAAAEDMGREHRGWFVGNHPGVTRAVEQFENLDKNPEGGVWVVVPHSRDLASQLFNRWRHTKIALPGSGLSDNAAWRSRKVWVAIPEDLKALLPLAQDFNPGLAGLIILDPECIIYKARGGRDAWGRLHPNDRPQHVVNFRAALNVDGWLPPVLLVTKRPAKSINTDVVARAFCLDGFRFIAGESFNCWDVPIEQDGKEGLVD